MKETKQFLRRDRAEWQRAAIGLLGLAVAGNVVLGGLCAGYRRDAAQWQREAERTAEVKDAAMQALGEMTGKVQDLEAELAVAPAAESPAEAVPVSRYAPITEDERELLARLVFLEAGSVSAQCQQACAEVVLNRVASEDFPDTVAEVIYDTTGGVQFTPAARISGTTATEAQYEAVDAALYGEYLLDQDVVYFSTTRQNDRVAAVYDGVVFCRGYDWGE